MTHRANYKTEQYLMWYIGFDTIKQKFSYPGWSHGIDFFYLFFFNDMKKDYFLHVHVHSVRYELNN